MFHQRLTRLESWLWQEGPAALGLSKRATQVERLAGQVLALSDLYTLERRAIGDEAGEAEHAAAKVLYFLCSDAPKVWLALDEWSRLDVAAGASELLAGSGESAGRLRVVDVGAGAGATVAGLLLSLDAAAVDRVTWHGLDRDARVLRMARTVAHRAAEIAAVRLDSQVAATDLRAWPESVLPEAWDLGISQATFSELFPVAGPGDDDHDPAAEAQAEWLRAWASRAPFLVIEPALRETTRPLHAARDRLLATGQARVIAPCPHQHACPMLARRRDWCHEVRLLPPTPRVAEVQALTRRRDERTKFSFLATVPAQRTPHAAATAPTAGLLARLVSDAMPSKGKVERVLCAQTGELLRLRLLDKERSDDNRLLADAPRGQRIRLLDDDCVPRVLPSTRVQPA